MSAPKVSVIVPCYNEEKTIHLLLTALLDQSFPTGQMEIVIADGISTDNTRRQIQTFQDDHPQLNIRVIDNNARTIPAALNRAIENAKGIYIIRLDAHSVPDKEYIIRCVENLEAGKGVNVGGVWHIKPGADTWVARSIAAAAAHPFGVGDAKYRYTDQPQYVDTVPFGAFRRDLVEEIGGFDENLLSNEDYEFNARIQRSGGKIWLDPSIHAVYFARSTYSALLKQYGRYGYWKINMLRRYPDTIRYRQAIPPLFVSSLGILVLLSFWRPLYGWILGAEVVSYALVLALAGNQMMIKNKDISNLLGVPLAIACMHIAWGSAFIWGGLSLLMKKAS